MIETPCWITGAETPGDLDGVHAWNSMIALGLTYLDDPNVAEHLADLCYGFRRVREKA